MDHRIPNNKGCSESIKEENGEPGRGSMAVVGGGVAEAENVLSIACTMALLV